MTEERQENTNEETSEETMLASPAGDSQGDGAQISDPAETLAALAAERDRLAAEKTEMHDRLLRKAAEFENFRRRVDRDRGEMLEYASMEAVRTILPILDDFERALKIEIADQEYVRGMELIYQRLYEALKRLGLEPIDAQGKPFDPHIHHAVEMSETEDAEDQTVLAEHVRGYNFKGRLLRPAMVKVAVKPTAERA